MRLPPPPSVARVNNHEPPGGGLLCPQKALLSLLVAIPPRGQWLPSLPPPGWSGSPEATPCPFMHPLLRACPQALPLHFRDNTGMISGEKPGGRTVELGRDLEGWLVRKLSPVIQDPRPLACGRRLLPPLCSATLMYPAAATQAGPPARPPSEHVNRHPAPFSAPAPPPHLESRPGFVWGEDSWEPGGSGRGPAGLSP